MNRIAMSKTMTKTMLVIAAAAFAAGCSAELEAREKQFGRCYVEAIKATVADSEDRAAFVRWCMFAAGYLAIGGKDCRPTPDTRLQSDCYSAR
jgi:hypothetical protein